MNQNACFSINDYSKKKLVGDIEKNTKLIKKLEDSIKNHNDELELKNKKLDELKKELNLLEKLQKFVQ